MKDQDDLVFDEDEAVKYILKNLPSEYKNKISSDDIDYVLDVMYEYYESNGFIEEDSAEEANIDEEEMFNFIMKTIKKEKEVTITEEELQLIIDGEFEYGKSIGVYKEAE
ncbi:MAG: hypothetical protein P4L28_01400 [Paludibacteraceae bacterium]|nr:hypothetical protein [Paludibacteraceae bacterium]